MSRADGVLVVVLKRKPFEDIRDGIKREEYREGSTYWMGKLLDGSYQNCSTCFHPYHTLRAYLGYAKGRQMLERKITGIRWGMPNPAWTYGIVSPSPCFIIELGPAQ